MIKISGSSTVVQPTPTMRDSAAKPRYSPRNASPRRRGATATPSTSESPMHAYRCASPTSPGTFPHPPGPSHSSARPSHRRATRRLEPRSSVRVVSIVAPRHRRRGDRPLQATGRPPRACRPTFARDVAREYRVPRRDAQPLAVRVCSSELIMRVSGPDVGSLNDDDCSVISLSLYRRTARFTTSSFSATNGCGTTMFISPSSSSSRIVRPPSPATAAPSPIPPP